MNQINLLTAQSYYSSIVLCGNKFITGSEICPQLYDRYKYHLCDKNILKLFNAIDECINKKTNIDIIIIEKRIADNNTDYISIVRQRLKYIEAKECDVYNDEKIVSSYKCTVESCKLYNNDNDDKPFFTFKKFFNYLPKLFN